MQWTWRDDGDKLTFIVCRPFELVSPGSNVDQSHDRGEEHSIFIDNAEARLKDEIAAMIGDVNLFISTVHDDFDDTDHGGDNAHRSNPSQSHAYVIGELELMIAERHLQRQGYGKAALLTFLAYTTRHERGILDEYHRHTTTPAPAPAQADTQFAYLSVKIGATNQRSLALFEGLGFKRMSELPSYFGEFELRLTRTGLDELVRNRGPEAGESGLGDELMLGTYRCACARSHNEGQSMRA
jgi:GNAT superfamily N-acetyltransferase